MILIVLIYLKLGYHQILILLNWVLIIIVTPIAAIETLKPVIVQEVVVRLGYRLTDNR